MKMEKFNSNNLELNATFGLDQRIVVALWLYYFYFILTSIIYFFKYFFSNVASNVVFLNYVFRD